MKPSKSFVDQLKQRMSCVGEDDHIIDPKELLRNADEPNFASADRLQELSEVDDIEKTPSHLPEIV